MDHVETILRNASSLTNNERAVLYDAFYIAPDSDSLARHIQQFNVPDDVTNALVEAKHAEAQQVSAPQTGTSRTAAAIQTIAGMDRAILDMAEKHPNVLRSLLSEIGSEPQ